MVKLCCWDDESFAFTSSNRVKRDRWIDRLGVGRRGGLLVSRGQTLFFAQGLYRFQYKRPARKRVWESL